jgi:hypothetical protein
MNHLLPDMNGLDPTETQGLLDALDDEYKAWSTYGQVIRDFGEIRPFVNIIQAEQRHIDALLGLCTRYGIQAPPNRWPGKVARYAALQDACTQAVQGEIENAALYDRVLRSTARQDLLEVYRALQSASTDRHLPAFRRCAARG